MAGIRHNWNLRPKEAVALQRRLAGRVHVEPLTDEVHTIAGVDCAFLDGGRRIIAAAVLCDAKSMETVATSETVLPCRFPYVPGLLSFREAPAVIEAVGKLPFPPDLLMCDGQGLAHPRGLGLASHVGLWLDLPTIGVAKSRLCGKHREVGLARRCRTQLLYHDKVIGSVVRTRSGVKPLYISVGHRITLDQSIRWTLRCCRSVRLCEPTRKADRYVAEVKKRLSGP